MATPIKPDFDHFKETCVFKLTAREEELLTRTVHPDELKEAVEATKTLELRFEAVCKILDGKLAELVAEQETFKARFNELLTMLHVQLANTGYLLLKIKET